MTKNEEKEWWQKVIDYLFCYFAAWIVIAFSPLWLPIWLAVKIYKKGENCKYMPNTLPLKENDIKRVIKDYLAYRGIFNFHLLQALGSYKGIPDRILHLGGKVIYLEIKKPGGKMSEHQIAFSKQCEADGIQYWCVESVEELQVLIEKILR